MLERDCVCRAVRKSRLLFPVLMTIGGVVLSVYPLLLLDLPSPAMCNLRNWVLNGGITLMIT